VQRHLFGYLLRRGVNLILTTHSPHIAAVAPLGTIVRLHQVDSGHTVAHTAGGAGLNNQQVADIERYLDVTRAEILFARFVILVEGTAELYLIPAFAQAAEFDLDAWGVVVTSVGGTDFVPYRRLLGTGGLSVAHVVISDGDRSVGSQYLGLSRACKLVPETAAKKLHDGVATLRKQEDAESERQLLELAAQHDVFLGEETLELDLIPLLADELMNSYHELPTSPQWQRRLGTAIEAIRVGRCEAADKQTVLDAIGRVGKGRFAQRLAAHVLSIGLAGLTQRVEELYRGGSKTHGAEQEAEVSSPAPMLRLHILTALDRASRKTRGYGLLEVVDV
jgi:putative ATP-dependent endonuclease of the OLD family